MQTTKFLTSIVFPDGAKTGIPVFYKEPVSSENPCNVLSDGSGGNMAFFKNCHFTVYSSKNRSLISKKDVASGKHIVTKEDQHYILDVYLEVDGDVISNYISLASPLPKGTEMRIMEIAKETDLFVFSGFSVFLFDIKKESF